MKELTTEQKAKAYDKTIERAKMWYYAPNSDKIPTYANRIVSDIFPELKESEDERIRKEMIEILRKEAQDFPSSVIAEKSNIWIAWLEKQVPAYLSHDDEIMIRQLTEYFTTGKGLQNTNGTVVEWLADVKRKLEKQGEQKPRYSIGDVLCDKLCTTLNKEAQPNIKIVDIRNGMYICDKCSFPISQQDEYELVAKKIEQKHTPKHKVGDTIYYNSFGEVKSMVVANVVTDSTDNPMYEDKEGNAVFEKDLIEQKLAENSAKVSESSTEEKDVSEYNKGFECGKQLVLKYPEDFGLCRKLADKVEPKFKVKYAGSEYNVFEIKDIAGVTFYGIEDEPNHIDYVKAENCEIISCYAIKENGSPYPTKPAVFSEQKSTPMSLDEAIEHCKEKSCGNNACALEHKQLERWLTELKELKEQNPAWSEEDEKMMDVILTDINYSQKNFSDSNLIVYDEKVNWFKSLKDRVQPKREWSEEDETILNNLIWALKEDMVLAGDRDEYVDWLKSLHPKNRRKPSEEQMTQLKKYCPDNRPLTSLYEQLKKLREE